MELLYLAGGLRGQEIGKLFRAGDRSMSHERRRLEDRLRMIEMLRIYSKDFLENITIEELSP